MTTSVGAQGNDPKRTAVQDKNGDGKAPDAAPGGGSAANPCLEESDRFCGILRSSNSAQVIVREVVTTIERAAVAGVLLVAKRTNRIRRSLPSADERRSEVLAGGAVLHSTTLLPRVHRRRFAAG